MPESANRAVATGKIHYVSHDFLGQGAARCEAVVIHFANHLELQKLAGRQQPPPPDAVRLSAEEARLLKEEARRKDEAAEALLRALFSDDDDETTATEQRPEENKSESEQVMSQPLQGESKKFDQRCSEREMEELRKALAESRASWVPRIAPNAKPDPDGWRLGDISGAAGNSLLIYRDASHRTHTDFNGEQWKGDDFKLIGDLQGITDFPELKKYAAELASYRLDEAPKANGADRSGFSTEDERKGWPVVMPVPAETPLPTPKPKDGYRFEMQHVYRDREGRVLWAVDRLISTAIPEAGKKRKKSFRPWTWRRLPGQPGRAQWAPYAPVGDLPLYGLDRLPGASQVLLVEGELKANIAQAMALPAGTAVLSYGATGKVERVDFGPVEGLPVVGWPDHDASGRTAMVAALLRCEGAGAIDPRMVVVPADFPDAWDLANRWPEADADPDARVCEMIGAAIPVQRAVGEQAETTTNGKAEVRVLPELPYIDPARDFIDPPPERDELLPGVAIRGNVGLMSGDGSSGKTTLMQQAANAGAFNAEWLDRPARSFRSLCFFAEEDRDEIHRRQIDQNAHFGRTMADLAGRVRYVGEGEDDNILVSFDPRSGHGVPTELFERLEAMIVSFFPDLVMLDPAAELFEGNEIVRNQVRRFISLLRRLARRRACAILLSMHPSLQGVSTGTGTSGSTGWNNSARLRSYLSTPKDELIGSPKRSLQTMKYNYGQAGGLIDMHWERGVYLYDRPAISTSGNVVDILQLDLLLAEIVREHVRNGDKISPSHDAKNGFANIVRKDPRARHLSQAAAIAAQVRMEEHNKLTRATIRVSGHDRIYVHTPDQLYPGTKPKKEN